jgi:hypothetical protein
LLKLLCYKPTDVAPRGPIWKTLPAGIGYPNERISLLEYKVTICIELKVKVRNLPIGWITWIAS